MKNQYKLAAAALMGLTLASCADDGLYEVNTPDWLAQRVDSIAAEKNKNQGDAPVLEGMMEDYYTIGKTDFTSGWWADFSKDYIIPDGEVWNAVFTLNINPSATNTYKNFALIVTNDVHRGDGGYTEYGACRFDHQPSGNSEWGDVFFQQHRDDVTSTLTFGTDTDEGVDKLGGKVILTIDRSNPEGFKINITNGVVTKTMDIKEPLPNLNEDGANTNIRAFLVVEGSYIQFEETNIVPIGGLTSKEDKQPLVLRLNNVPRDVQVGTPIEDVLARISATVEFEEGVSKDVTLDELEIQVIPEDMETLGLKTIVAVYNKTFKGENCSKPVIATAQFEVVFDTTPYTTQLYFVNPVVLGMEDNSTGWWTAHTEQIRIPNRQTAVVGFTNYTTCAENWHNFCVILNREDLSEYCVVRADNFGWGAGYDNNPGLEHGCDWDDFVAWRNAMNGAHVTAFITNNGDGTASIKAVMEGTDGVTYTVHYNGISGVDKDDLWLRFTCEASHLVFDTPTPVTPSPQVVGFEDNSTPWWSAFSDNLQIMPYTAVTTSFTNYSSGANNWNNFNVILNGAALNEYCVVRADNYGWGAGYDGNEQLVREGTQGDWATWLAAMNGAHCSVTITNHGGGTADIDCVMEGTNGVTYTQYYHNILVDSEDLYFRFVMDGSHIVFD